MAWRGYCCKKRTLVVQYFSSTKKAVVNRRSVEKFAAIFVATAFAASFNCTNHCGCGKKPFKDDDNDDREREAG